MTTSALAVDPIKAVERHIAAKAALKEVHLTNTLAHCSRIVTIIQVKDHAYAGFYYVDQEGVVTGGPASLPHPDTVI